MQARLVAIDNGTVVRVYPVEAAGTVYGRAGGDLVQIEDPEVSKQHFRVHLRRDEWHILDLGSKNGTFVNGEKVGSGILQHGDSVKLGGTSLYFITGHEADMPVTGQAIDISRKAYQQTMEHRSVPAPAPGVKAI